MVWWRELAYGVVAAAAGLISLYPCVKCSKIEKLSL